MQSHGNISLGCKDAEVSHLNMSTPLAIRTWQIGKVVADAHDVAEHFLQGRVGGFDGEGGSGGALDLEASNRLAALVVLVILDGEGVRLDHLLAVFGVGVDEDLKCFKSAIFQSNKGNFLLEDVSRGDHK